MNKIEIVHQVYEKLDKKIPIKDLEKIFEKFYRTDKSRNKNSGGTGLGMSILKKIVDIHKGKINLQSKENIGTTLTISFPIENNF